VSDHHCQTSSNSSRSSRSTTLQQDSAAPRQRAVLFRLVASGTASAECHAPNFHVGSDPLRTNPYCKNSENRLLQHRRRIGPATASIDSRSLIFSVSSWCRSCGSCVGSTYQQVSTNLFWRACKPGALTQSARKSIFVEVYIGARLSLACADPWQMNILRDNRSSSQL